MNEMNYFDKIEKKRKEGIFQRKGEKNKKREGEGK